MARVRRVGGLFLVVSFPLLFLACKGSGDPAPVGIPATEAVLVVAVSNPAGQPVAGASVQVGDTQQVTDAEGRTRFEKLVPGRLVARVTAGGYVPTTAVVDAPGGVETVATKHLLGLGARTAFQVADGLVLLRDRVRLEIPAGALVDAAGKPAAGEAEVTVVPLDPTTKALDQAPGPFHGIRLAGGDPVLLDSGYMADITVWQGDQRLQMAAGQKATVGFVLPDKLQGTIQPGMRVPLWWYDLEAGAWREEGDGVIEAGATEADAKTWVAQVGHFSWFNYDRPLEYRNCVIVRALDADLQPVPGVTIRVAGGPTEAIPWGGFETGTTNPQGTACIDFPRQAAVRITAKDPKGFPLSKPVDLQGPAEAASCKFTNGVGCVEVELDLDLPCEVDGDCGADDPCLVTGTCQDGKCTFAPATWVGTPCNVGGNCEGEWACMPWKCPIGTPCTADDLKVCTRKGQPTGCCEDADCDDRNPCTDDWCDQGQCRNATPAAWVGTACAYSGEFGTCNGTWRCDPRRCKGGKDCTLDQARLCVADPDQNPAESCCTQLRCEIRSKKGNCDVVFNAIYGSEPGDSPRAKCQGMCAKGVKDFDKEAGKSGCQVGLHGLTCASCCALGALPVIDRPCDDDPCTEDQCDEERCHAYPLGGQICQARNQYGTCSGKTKCQAGDDGQPVVTCDAPTPAKDVKCD